MNSGRNYRSGSLGRDYGNYYKIDYLSSSRRFSISSISSISSRSSSCGPAENFGVRNSYKSPYNRDNMSNNHYGSSSTRYGTDKFSSYSSKPSGAYSSNPSTSRYSSGLSRFDKGSRSTSYSTGIQNIGDSSRYTSAKNSSTMSTSMYSTSYSSYSRPSYRSQTPSYPRDTPLSRHDREYRSMSRFGSRESSLDRFSERKVDSVEDTYSKIYDKYVRKDESSKKILDDVEESDSESEMSNLGKLVQSESEKEKKQLRRSSGVGGLLAARKSSITSSKEPFSGNTSRDNRSKSPAAVSKEKSSVTDISTSLISSKNISQTSNSSTNSSTDPSRTSTTSEVIKSKVDEKDNQIPEKITVEKPKIDKLTELQEQLSGFVTSSESPKKSESKPPVGKSETNNSKDSVSVKRVQRRERTLEMEKFVQNKFEKIKKDEENGSANSVSLSIPIEDGMSRPPPLLLVTQASTPSTPVSEKIIWDRTKLVPEGDSTSDEDEEYEDEEFDEDCEVSVSLPGVPKGDLYPVDPTGLSTSTFSDYDSEFELPFMQPESRADSRGRVPQSNAIPPPAPVFTASVTFDDDMEESIYFPAVSRIDTASGGSRTYLSPISYPSEEEYIESVEVGCTLTLVQKAAMKDSEEETSEEYYSDEEEEEEEEIEEEEIEEEEVEEIEEEEVEEEEVEEEEIEEEEIEEVEEEEDIEIETTLSFPSTTVIAKEEHPGPSRSPIERPKLEDKTAVRKSTLNMTEEEKHTVEKKQAQELKDNFRKNGTVSSIRERFRESSPPKEEKITYKRSSRLEPKDDRPKRTYEIVKPVINDEFEKKMKELREQMKTGSNRLQSQMKEVSKGIDSEVGERKLRSMKSKHEEIVGTSKSFQSKAENEKKRWIEQRENETEKKNREISEKKSKMNKTEEERKNSLSTSEPKTTIRRSKKKEEEDIKNKQIREDQMKVLSSFEKSITIKKIVEDEFDDLIYDLATTKPAIPEAVKKCDGGVANKIKKNLVSERSGGSPEKLQNSEDKRKLKRFFQRRKTDELILLQKENTKQNRKQKRRKNKFIREISDIDVFLGWDTVSFEEMESFLDRQSSLKMKNGAVSNGKKRIKVGLQKIWISDLTDIDKIYKISELRDIKISAFE